MKQPKIKRSSIPRGLIISFLLIILLSYVASVFQLFVFLLFPNINYLSSIVNLFVVSCGFYILTKTNVRRIIILIFPFMFIFLNVFLRCMFSFTVLSCIYRTLGNINYYLSYIPALFMVYLIHFLFKPRVAKRPVSSNKQVDGSGTGDT